MDKIFLHGLRVETLIGLYEWERQNLQTLVFDLEIGVSQPFSNHDEINDTVHYGIVCDRLRAHLREQQFFLLETLANHVATFLFTEFEHVAWLKLRIVKLGILPNVREVGVEIERARP